MAADLDSVFFNTDDFAESCTYTPAAGSAVVISVIFDKLYDGQSGVGSFRYFCTAKTADVSAAKPGETMVIGGVTYKIKDPPHNTNDGTSEIELSLE
jgi:hypothetical protein